MKKRYWWYREFGQLLPADENEKYPHAGAVVRRYRERKGWTRRRLAGELGLLSEKMILYLESDSRGLDSIVRRRELVALLEIPPVLLGLDSLYAAEARPWWITEGYSFRADSSGCYPAPGSVAKHFREQKKKKLPGGTEKSWTQRDLADALGISEISVRAMENHNKGLDSISRRKMLSFMLNIPPALLGLDALIHEPVIGERSTTALRLPKSTKLSREALSSFRAIQNQSYEQYFVRDGQDMLSDASRWISYLDSLRTSASTNELEELLALQSGYSQLVVAVGREMKDYRIALSYANKAVSFAESTENSGLVAVALWRRSEALREYGDLSAALVDIDKALFHAKNASGYIQGHVLADAGRLHAELAQDMADRKYAQSLFEQAGHIARTTGFESDPHHIKYNLGIYHIRRADGLLALHQPTQPTAEQALDELQLATRETSPEMVRRLLLIDILQAQAYIKMKKYDQALDIALSALEGAKQIKSRVNRDRVETIYHTLSSTGVDSVKLARLGWMLNSW